MLRKVNNSPTLPASGLNDLLMIAYKAVTPAEIPAAGTRCRFDLFVRMRPGNISTFKNQQRTWCYRGDKYTTEEYKMLRNLLNLIKSKMPMYDRIELYDNSKAVEERVILKIVDDCIHKNALNQYSLMLTNYALPDFLKIIV